MRNPASLIEQAARNARRTLLLETLIQTKWSLTLTAHELGLCGAGSTLQTIRRMGLVEEYEQAKRDGLIRTGGDQHARSKLHGKSRQEQRTLILAALHAQDWNLSRAATELNIARGAALVDRMQLLGMGPVYDEAKRLGKVTMHRAHTGPANKLAAVADEAIRAVVKQALRSALGNVGLAAEALHATRACVMFHARRFGLKKKLGGFVHAK